MVTVNRNRCGTSRRIRAGVLGLAVLLALAGAPAVKAAVTQATFASPDEAVAALVTAAREGKSAELARILGPDGKRLVYSGDRVADRAGREKFVAAYDEMHKLTPEGEAKSVVAVGKDEWPFPIPMVRQGATWRFDTKAGAQEILDRRIGRNELNAIEVCRAYADAQREYAANDMSGGTMAEYAQKFMSSPGKHDGLYWPAEAGQAESPMGPLAAQARAEGYDAKADGRKHSPYHGYYYRILTKQGKDAPGGAFDYVVNGHMIGGFALVAFPAKYKDSGVMTFMINHDGIVFQKNLGPNTRAIARGMKAFEPDASWRKVE